MTIKSNLLLVSVLLSVVSAQVDLSSKTRYYKDGLTDAFHLANLIIPATYTYTTYSDTSKCYSSVCNNPSAMTAYKITYTPSLGSAVACFCDNAVFDITYMADNVGRVPFIVREKVVTYTAASRGKGSGAFATYDGYVIFQDVGENTEVFLHESGHTFDLFANNGLSSSTAYQNAISNDACVPDDYAATNPIEDFAQLTVTWVYLALTNSPTPACLSQSISYMSQVLPKSSIQAQLQTYGQSTSTPTSSPTSAPATPAPATPAPTPSSCTIGVRQTLSNSWTSSGVTYTQYAVAFVNNGASDVQASNLAVQLLGGQISQIWNLEQQKSGAYALPSYQNSIAAGNQYSWGYVVQGSSPLSISFLLPSSCSASSTSAPTSAPVTSAPVTSAPVTSAPVTSAPVTSAPVTSAPTPSSTTAPGSSSCAFEITQTLANSWISNGITYSQYNVVYRNAGSTPAAAVVQLGGGVITQIWNVEQQNGANGYYYLPSYQSTIAPNAQYSWGYVAQTSSALTIRLIC